VAELLLSSSFETDLDKAKMSAMYIEGKKEEVG
jgi:hypothetical protein